MSDEDEDEGEGGSGSPPIPPEQWVDVTGVHDRIMGYEVQTEIARDKPKLRHRIIGTEEWTEGAPRGVL